MPHEGPMTAELLLALLAERDGVWDMPAAITAFVRSTENPRLVTP